MPSQKKKKCTNPAAELTWAYFEVTFEIKTLNPTGIHRSSLLISYHVWVEVLTVDVIGLLRTLRVA